MSETSNGLVHASLPGGITITGTPAEVAETIRLVQSQVPQTANVPFVQPWPEILAKGHPCCTCHTHGTWMSIFPPPPCPVHGGGHITVTHTG